MSGALLYFTLAVATLAVSWAAIIIRWADADPISTAFYRMLFSAVILAIPAAPGFFKNLKRLPTGDYWRLCGSGVLLGLHFATWITSLKYTTISNSVILVATQPFFVASVESFVFKEKISTRAIWGMLLAFAGMVVISRADFQLGGNRLFGDILALIGAFCAGGYLMLGRKIRQTLDNRYYVFPVHVVATVTMLLIVSIFHSPLTGFSGKTWLCFFLLALIPTALGHNLYNYLLKFIRAHLVAVTILGEPLGATVFAAIIFGEMPHISTYIGGGMILIGILIALIRVKSDPIPFETA